MGLLEHELVVAAVLIMLLLDYIWPKRYLVHLHDLANDMGLGGPIKFLSTNDLLDSKRTILVDFDR